MIVCKRCGHDEFIRKGSDPHGRKRHKCKECGSQAWPLEIDIEAEADVEIIKRNVLLAKQKQKLQDVNRIERKSFRKQARIENSYEAYVEELVRVLKDKEFTPVKRHITHNPSAIIVHISDTHFNELVDLENNKYDFKVASKRLYKFAKRIGIYAKMNDIKNIYLTMTGDLINSDRRTDELLNMATNRTNATVLAVELLQKFIDDLNAYANITVISVSGNESRVREEFSTHKLLMTDNYDCMIYQVLKKLYKQSNSVTFISGDTDEYVFKLNGTSFLLTHGMHLRTMKASNVAQTIARYSNKGAKVDYILCGHLHETKIKDILLRCGSLVGANAYSDKTLNLTGKASQNLHVVYGNGDVDSIRVDLQNVPDNVDEMYDIEEQLAEYNAKSLDKVKKEYFIYEANF